MSLLQNIVIKNRNITEGISRALHFIYNGFKDANFNRKLKTKT
jgi:hypothetical protein